MLRKSWALLLILMLSMTLFVGCSDDDDPTAPTTMTPAEQFDAMAAAGIAYINGGAPNVIKADALEATLVDDTYTVLDIRDSSDYIAGHIPGAYNTSLGTLLDDLGTRAFPVDKPFVVVCYSGQTAGQAVVALEMLNYEAKLLKYGMCSWNSTLNDSWENSCTTLAVDWNDVELTANALTTTYAFPTWDTGAESADEVIAARVEYLLEDVGFKRVSYMSMRDNGIDGYSYVDGEVFVLNYFSDADYMPGGAGGVPGHLTGAFQFDPGASLGADEMLEYLPNDGTPIVVYCWTGQTASQVSAYLRMLGYNSYSLLFSSNALWHDDLTAGGHKWDAGTDSHSYDLE